MGKLSKREIFFLDSGIEYAVRLLIGNGIETYESCEGGDNHAFSEPTVRFHGGQHEGYRAFAIVQAYGLPVASLNRHWDIIDGELVGPTWEMIFYEQVPMPKNIDFDKEFEWVS